MSDYEFTLSLSIRHPAAVPTDISRTLGIEPQHSWQVGDERRTPTGEILEGTYRETFWMGRLTPAPESASDRVSIESALLRTLAQLRKSFDFFADLTRGGGNAELQISILSRDDFRLEFVPELLALLGRLGLTISLSITPYSSPATAAAN